MEEVWIKRFDMIRFLGWMALLSPFLAVGAALSHDLMSRTFGVAAVVLFLPVFFYVYVVTIWHCKARYRGKHSDLWGALILIETSGWSKNLFKN